MQTLKFINSRGGEVLFDLSPPFILWKLEGLELPSVEPIFTQASGQNGYSLHQILMDERQVKLTGHVHGASGMEEMYAQRKRINAVCNPLLGVGELVYQNDSGIWKIPAFAKGTNYTSRVKNIQTLDVLFECPMPFWLAKEPTAILLAYVEGGLEFPIKTPGFFGTLGYRALLDNDSDVLTPVEMFIEGGSINPVITNRTTGSLIKLAKQLQSYDKLYINTDPEFLEVSLVTIDPKTNQPVKQNAFGYLTADSDEHFSLVPGVNEVVFMSDDENKKVSIRILFF